MLADLTRRVATEELTSETIPAVMATLLDSGVADETKAAFLSSWTRRGETARELAACAEALLPRASDPGVRGDWNGKPLMDCCGTGGGGLNLLNVSTGIVFLLSALGIPVVKHGNRGLTKKSGSADVLEAMGIRIDLPPQRIAECLEHVGAAFLFAPAFHASFAAVASVRRQLATAGQRTIFNLLGPLLNPARPNARLVGVFQWDHLKLYRDALMAMDCPRFAVACGEDEPSERNIGEVSAQGVTLIEMKLEPSAEPFRDRQTYQFDKPQRLEELLVTDAAESARRLTNLLSGEERGFARLTLLVNAAVAARMHGTAASQGEAMRLATHALDSGAALNVLRRWQDFSR